MFPDDQILQFHLFFQLIESGIQNKLVAELYLPIPEPSHMSGRVELGSFEFSSDQQVFYKHEGVGSGELLQGDLKTKDSNVIGFFPLGLLSKHLTSP